MTPHLTSAGAELDRKIKATPPGMMYWAETCSDPAATCSGCRHFGFSIVQRNDAGNAISVKKHPDRCALVWKYTNKPGAAFCGLTPACKYFESRQP
jgi:hypothetical protein